MMLETKQWNITTFPQAKSGGRMEPLVGLRMTYRVTEIHLLFMIYNIITHAYIPDEYVPQILNIDDTGQKLYEDYVAERINGDVSLWAHVNKQNNKMYMSGNKTHNVKFRDKIVDLKETKDLYVRLMVLARSNRDIDQKQAVWDLLVHTDTKGTLFTKWLGVAMH